MEICELRTCDGRAPALASQIGDQLEDILQDNHKTGWREDRVALGAITVGQASNVTHPRGDIYLSPKMNFFFRPPEAFRPNSHTSGVIEPKEIVAEHS